MNEEIEKIAEQEAKVCLRQEYLYILFFVAAAILFGITIWTLFVSKEDGQVKGARIIITLSVFLVVIVLGYLYHQYLSKVLKRLGEKKKPLLWKINS